MLANKYTNFVRWVLLAKAVDNQVIRNLTNHMRSFGEYTVSEASH